jgi:hypothetical protein
VAEIGNVNWDFDLPAGTSESEDALFGRLGIRWRLFSLLELNGLVIRIEPSNSDFKKSYDEIFSQNKSRVGAVVYLGPIGLGLDLFATNETSGAAS